MKAFDVALAVGTCVLAHKAMRQHAATIVGLMRPVHEFTLPLPTATAEVAGRPRYCYGRIAGRLVSHCGADLISPVRDRRRRTGAHRSGWTGGRPLPSLRRRHAVPRRIGRVR